MSRRNKWALVVLAVIACGIAAVSITLSLPQFGSEITGERLKRVEASIHHRDGTFFNAEREASNSAADVWASIKGQFGGDEIRVPPSPMPVVEVTAESLALSALPTLRAFWIGHASAYIELDGARLLIDPVFSEYASPFEIGPNRFHPPPIALTDLPKIDAVMISHDHYDHLDMKTVQHLAKAGTLLFVPLGIGAHLERWGIPLEQIRELEWWQERQVGPLRIVSTPNRHYSGRKLSDYQATLWSSWSVIGPQHRFYFSGDTGYTKYFKEIGERFGPFDLAFIKIGAYGPGDPWTDIHMTPEQAVQANVDVRGKRMFPVHWGTFNLAFHRWDEPIERALAAAQEAQVELVTPRVGEMVTAGQVFESTAWWKAVR